MPIESPNLFIEPIEGLVPRVLSLWNRNPISKTYGCFDRNYWNFKTLVDFPCATYQQGVYGLSRLLETPASGNRYHDQPVIAEAVRAGILYWCDLQNPDGSFNEYYENDRSFCPTAFTTFGVGGAYLASKERFGVAEQKRVEKHLLSAGLWLARHTNPDVYNQMTASMLALYFVGEAVDNSQICDAFGKRRRSVLDAQSPEGWFPEYGGADVGYSFLTLDLLATYLSRREDADIREAGIRLVDFASHFLHPDGTCGGEYGSRATQHVLPWGALYFASQGVASARRVIAWFIQTQKERCGISGGVVDDKYSTYFYFASYVEAQLSGLQAEFQDDSPVSASSHEIRYFEGAGILRIEQGDLLVWIGYRRNGVCRIYWSGTCVHADCGYAIEFEDGQAAVSQGTDPNARVSIREEGDETCVEVVGRASLYRDVYPLRRWYVPFKLACRTLLRLDRLAYWLHDRVKADNIKKNRLAALTVNRSFRFRPGVIEIHDRIQSEIPSRSIKQVRILSDVTTVHSPSSRFFVNGSLRPFPSPRVVAATPDSYNSEMIYKTDGTR
jgi:hypothetical protein